MFHGVKFLLLLAGACAVAAGAGWFLARDLRRRPRKRRRP